MEPSTYKPRVSQLATGAIIVRGPEPKSEFPAMDRFVECPLPTEEPETIIPELQVSESRILINGKVVLNDLAVVSSIVHAGQYWYVVKGSTLFIFNNDVITKKFRLKTNYYPGIVVFGTFLYVYSVDFELTVIDLVTNQISSAQIPLLNEIVPLDFASKANVNHEDYKSHRLFGVIGSYHNIYHILYKLNYKTKVITRQLVQIYNGDQTTSILEDLQVCEGGVHFMCWDVAHAIQHGTVKVDFGILLDHMKNIPEDAAIQLKRLQILNYLDAGLKKADGKGLNPLMDIYEHYFSTIDYNSLDPLLFRNNATLPILTKIHNNNLPKAAEYECILCDEPVKFEQDNYFETKCSSGHINSCFS